MKHLEPEQLARLDAYWKDWASQPTQEKQLRVRLRLYFIYLLIRHGGLRLGEALALDDNRDLVFSTATVRIRGSRDIQIQEQAMVATGPYIPCISFPMYLNMMAPEGTDNASKAEEQT